MCLKKCGCPIITSSLSLSLYLSLSLSLCLFLPIVVNPCPINELPRIIINDEREKKLWYVLFESETFFLDFSLL